MTVQTPTPPSANVTEDLPCAQCGYLLRGLEPDGRCPECNHSIGSSIETRARLPARRTLRALKLGAVALLVALALQPFAVRFAYGNALPRPTWFYRNRDGVRRAAAPRCMVADPPAPVATRGRRAGVGAAAAARCGGRARDSRDADVHADLQPGARRQHDPAPVLRARAGLRGCPDHRPARHPRPRRSRTGQAGGGPACHNGSTAASSCWTPLLMQP